jgi:hypothetical protein
MGKKEALAGDAHAQFNESGGAIAVKVRVNDLLDYIDAVGHGGRPCGHGRGEVGGGEGGPDGAGGQDQQTAQGESIPVHDVLGKGSEIEKSGLACKPSPL